MLALGSHHKRLRIRKPNVHKIGEAVGKHAKMELKNDRTVEINGGVYQRTGVIMSLEGPSVLTKPSNSNEIIKIVFQMVN